MGLPIGQEARKRQRIAAHRHHHRLRAGQGKASAKRYAVGLEMRIPAAPITGPLKSPAPGS
jgi:hypothetical protein